MVNCASLMISWIRPYYTMTQPLMWCKPKTDFSPETYENSVPFQAVNTWFSRQGHYVFFIIQLLPNVVFRIRGCLGVGMPFRRLFGDRFSLLPDKWSNWRLRNLVVFYELLVLRRGVFQTHILILYMPGRPEKSHYMVFIVTCLVRRWQTCV